MSNLHFRKKLAEQETTIKISSTNINQHPESQPNLPLSISLWKCVLHEINPGVEFIFTKKKLLIAAFGVWLFERRLEKYKSWEMLQIRITGSDGKVRSCFSSLLHHIHRHHFHSHHPRIHHLLHRCHLLRHMKVQELHSLVQEPHTGRCPKVSAQPAVI